jgi:hypothetical protein
MKELKGRISITRPTYGNGDKFIDITLEDRNSLITFLNAKITYEDFTKALTGQGDLPVIMEVNGLDKVGLVRETKGLVFPVPDYMRAKDYAKEHAQEFADLGWIASGYFGSQSSIRQSEDKTHYEAHGTQSRYVNPDITEDINLKEFPDPAKIIEGVDLNYDLMQLLGYTVALGWTEKQMPSSHVIALHQRFLDLYGNQKTSEFKDLKFRMEGLEK